MKTTNTSIKDSAVVTLTDLPVYTIIFPLSGIVITAVSFLTFTLSNISYVGLSFNF